MFEKLYSMDSNKSPQADERHTFLVNKGPDLNLDIHNVEKLNDWNESKLMQFFKSVQAAFRKNVFISALFLFYIEKC